MVLHGLASPCRVPTSKLYPGIAAHSSTTSALNPRPFVSNSFYVKERPRQNDVSFKHDRLGFCWILALRVGECTGGVCVCACGCVLERGGGEHRYPRY